MRLLGKVAIVTGGGSGIGQGIAEAFGCEGAQVVVADIMEDAARETASRIAVSGGKSTYTVADVCSLSAVDAMVNGTVREFGQLDVLVTCAGIGETGTIFETSKESWDRTLNVNLTGVFLCCKRALMEMVPKRKGSIINMASTTSIVGCARRVAYAASKGGVLALTRTLAIDHAADRVRVNAIIPGSIDTPLARQVREADSEALEHKLAGIPLGRFGIPNDIAHAAVYLASEESSFVTGHGLVVDGGVTAR